MKISQHLIAAISVFGYLTMNAGTTPKSHISSGPALSSAKPVSSFMRMDYDDETPNSVVKMNVSQLGLRNLSFQYEYGFHKNMSGAIGFSKLLEQKSPAFFTEEDPTGEGLRNTKIRGFAITPEFRYYPGVKEEHQAPHGFYVGAYYRYAKYTYTSDYSVKASTGRTYAYDLVSTYKGGTLGVLIGSQWIIGKHFSIDWWILGGGAGNAKFVMEATGSGFIMNAQEQADVKAAVEDRIGDVPVVDLGGKVTTTSNSVKVTSDKLPMLGFRGFGLCLGFAF